jgi:endoglucanase
LNLKTNDNEIFALIKELSEAEGLAGFESKITDILSAKFEKKAAKIKKIGNSLLVTLFPEKTGKKNILIDAHIDRVGFRVTYITDEGFLKIGNAGGFDFRQLPAALISVAGADGSLPGVISTKPPHLSGAEKSVPGVGDISIDIGMDKETALKTVPLGAAVYLKNSCERLAGDRITGAAFDNRAGAAAVIIAAEELLQNPPDCNIHLLFSEGEEVTERGAKIIGGAEIAFDEAIIVDTSFAKGNGEDEKNSGGLNGGVMIGVSSSLDSDLSNIMIKTAKDSEIPYQIEVMPGKTGTNADEIAVTSFSGGIKSVTLSFPIRNMHTPVEVLSLSDIKATAELIVKYAGGVKS